MACYDESVHVYEKGVLAGLMAHRESQVDAMKGTRQHLLLGQADGHIAIMGQYKTMWQECYNLPVVGHPITYMCLDASDRICVTLSQDKRLTILNTMTMKKVFQKRIKAERYLECLCMAGKQILFGQDCRLEMMDVSDNEQKTLHDNDNVRITQIVYGAGHVYLADEEGDLKVFKLEGDKATLVKQEKAHLKRVKAL